MSRFTEDEEEHDEEEKFKFQRTGVGRGCCVVALLVAATAAM